MASFNKIRMGALTTPAESISEPLRIAQTLESFLEKSVKTAYHFPLTFRIVFSQFRLDDLCQLS